MKIILTPPDKNSPGFNRRMYNAALIQEKMQAGMTAALYKEFLEFLAGYITVEFAEGETPISNFEAMMDYATQDQTEALFAALQGDAAFVPPVNSAPSATP